MRDGFNFTDRVRTVLQMSREQAQRLHHEYVSTEHILLGIIQEGHGVAFAMLAAAGVDPDAVRARIAEVVRPGRSADASSPELPYTSRSKKVLELAMVEARERGHSYTGTEHLLVGLAREKMGIGAQALAEAGATLETLREVMPGAAKPTGADSRDRLHAEVLVHRTALRAVVVLALGALIVAIVALARTF